jgi:hypothetical protein
LQDTLSSLSEYVGPTESDSKRVEDANEDEESITGGSFNRDESKVVALSPSRRPRPRAAGGESENRSEQLKPLQDADRRDFLQPREAPARQPVAVAAGAPTAVKGATGALPSNWMDAISQDTFKPRAQSQLQQGKSVPASSGGASVVKVGKSALSSLLAVF